MMHGFSKAFSQSIKEEADKCKLKSPLISIIMPAYNLSKSIAHSIDVVKRVMEIHGFNYEIIVVDDGSVDSTFRVAIRKHCNPHVRVYRLPKNMGKGFALIYGFKKSRGDLVAFFDGDLDIDPRQIVLLINALRRVKADAVVTSKWHTQSRTKASFTRRFLSKSFYALAKVLLGVKVSDTQTGAKIFRRQVLEEVAHCLVIKRYAFDVELLTAIATRGYRIIEVPAIWGIKLNSRFKIKEAIRMLIDLLAITYRHKVKKQYSVFFRDKVTLSQLF
ncbi:MAG: glycosyltransferase family 2 protein [Desulfurococcaceae archaeon]